MDIEKDMSTEEASGLEKEFKEEIMHVIRAFEDNFGYITPTTSKEFEPFTDDALLGALAGVFSAVTTINSTKAQLPTLEIVDITSLPGGRPILEIMATVFGAYAAEYKARHPHEFAIERGPSAIEDHQSIDASNRQMSIKDVLTGQISKEDMIHDLVKSAAIEESHGLRSVPNDDMDG